MRSFLKKIYSKICEKKPYIVLAIMVIFLICIGYKYFYEYRHILKDPNKVKNIIMSYGKYSVIVFLALQVLQVVAFFIPGEIVQIVGGYIYGTFFGSVISLAGITAGSALVYCISNTYGKALVNKIISDKDLKFFKRILSLGKINQVVFLLYLIPGIPKDVLAYICGISDITFKNFMIYSTIGRIPGIVISAYFGSQIILGSKILLWSIAVLMSVLFIIGVFKGEKIVKSIFKKNS